MSCYPVNTRSAYVLLGLSLLLQACGAGSGSGGEGSPATQIDTLELLGAMRLSVTSFDDDANGTVDRTLTETYNDSGLLISSEERNIPDDGSLDLITYINDSASRVSRVETDLGGDGIVDMTLSIAYDGEGRELARTGQDLTGGSGTRVFTRLYDSEGRWSGSSIDLDNDGQVDATSSNFYDSSGALLRREFDLDLDGVADTVNVYTRGSAGEDDLISVDLGNDGTFDQVLIFDYEFGDCVLSQFAEQWGTVCLP